MTTMDRRAFLGRGLAATGGALLSSMALDRLCAPRRGATLSGHAPVAAPGDGYGPLRRRGRPARAGDPRAARRLPPA